MKDQEREKDELKKIFDELRSIGKSFSLNDALDKAIRREKDSLAKMSEIPGEKLFFGGLRRERVSLFPLRVTMTSVLILGIACTAYIVRTSDETTLRYPIRENSKLLRVENRN